MLHGDYCEDDIRINDDADHWSLIMLPVPDLQKSNQYYHQKQHHNGMKIEIINNQVVATIATTSSRAGV